MQRSSSRIRWTFIALILSISVGCVLGPAGALTPTLLAATKGQAAQTQTGQETAPAEVTTLVAGLSDEQVRKLLIDELQKAAKNPSAVLAKSSVQPPGIGLASLLDALSSRADVSEQASRALFDAVPRFWPDIYHVLLGLCPYGTPTGAVENMLWIALFLVVGIIAETVFRRVVHRRLFANGQGAHDQRPLSALERILASMVREMPALLGILIFFCASYFAYFAFIWTDLENLQIVFLALLLSITIIRLFATVSRVLLSPTALPFRLLPLECSMANTIYWSLTAAASYIIVAIMVAVVLRKLGAQDDTVRIYFIVTGTLLLTVTAIFVMVLRKRVREQIISSSALYGEEASWGRRQFAAIWHILALAYLFVLWLLFFNDVLDPEQKRRGAFILSFFVVPIWMVADRILQWLVKHMMATLKIHHDQHDDPSTPSEEELQQRESGRQLFVKVMVATRLTLVLVLGVWIASLWNLTIPLFSNLSGVFFDALLILTVAIFFWQFVSGWIERKIEESEPAETEKKDDEEDDWGAAANRGRAYTLLPMLRKFIATVLVTMVTMTILSSMGVDIGPLLAGAGVVGLAVGFGAQKIVADMLSGFFYLLDDAFRVGEYIEAGGITGTVENITLRNVMLRHHRGMLQIVPHSDLGSITNYMRGGIIVKFNLDFPYDADIDQIRKIIKKVGQTMMAEEEFAKDFIRPLKSQGVREITNSVMTIRAKFTAKPGAHFLIRREAYKRITEALRAKGIHYAHRKVIVDLPSTGEQDSGQAAKIAGAAARELIDAEEQAKAAGAAAGKGLPDM